jgi:hypothetical protein
MGVEKGNKVFILAESLSEAGQKVTIKWSQSFKDRSEEYYVTKYTNKSGSRLTSLLPSSSVAYMRLTQVV